jgi:hypothetical protein
MKRQWLISIGVMVVISACNQATPVNLQATASVLASQFAPAPTSFTETPGLAPSSTATPTFTPQPTSTLTQEWTPRPTLSPQQAQAFGLKLFKTNGNCLLPCWIGLTPGKTSWNEAYAFLATFADSISSRDNLLSKVHTIRFKFPDTSYRGVSETAATIILQDGVIDKIRTPEDISLSELLSAYGSPTEIRILIIGTDTMDPIGRFTLVLFYQNNGIMAVYDGINERSKIVHICPNHIQGLQQRWLLWAPVNNLTFTEAGKEILLISPYPPPAESDYIALENLSDLSIDAFTQRYSDPKNQGICMEMQAPE